MLNINYRIEPGEFGTKRIIETGRCTEDELWRIEPGVCEHYVLVKIPEARGVVLKSFDGVLPVPQVVGPLTTGRFFYCVKVSALMQPLTNVQSGGPYDGHYICHYQLVWQEVGGVS